MFHGSTRSTRSTLAIIAILAGVSLFSIGVEAAPTNQSVSHVQLAGSDDELTTSPATPNGVFGWD